jgi:FkbM family methyltransferase
VESEEGRIDVLKKLKKLTSDIKFSVSFGADLGSKVKMLYLLIKPFFSFSRFNPQNIHRISAKFKDSYLDITLRDNGSDVIILREMFIHQDYRESAQHFSPNVIFDIGANVGLAGCYFASIFPNSEIYGFEPESGSYRVAEINYRNIRRGKLFKVALTSQNGEANILSSDIGSGGQKLEIYDPSSNWKREKVKTCRLDDLIRMENLPIPDLLKIDVEGAEYDVLLGLGDISQKVKGIVMEVHSDVLWEKCSSFLSENGFLVLRNEQKFGTEVRFIYAEQRTLISNN